ncbi:hypothetical protein BG000_002936 [Podila horticola]|nr:hypothetical protein BG000_002936 [Podila horticola]
MTGAHDLMLNQFLWDGTGTNVEGSSNHRGTPSSKYPPPLDTSSARLSDPIFPGTTFRNGRSLSFSEPSFSSVLEGEGSSTSIRPGLTKSTFPSDDDSLMDMRSYRSSLLPTMEEETEDSTEQRMSRARSFSTSATFGLSSLGLSSPGFGSNTFGPGETDVFANNASFMSGNQGVGSGNTIHHNNNNNTANIAHTTNTNNGSSRPFLHRKLSGGLPAWSSPSNTLDQASNHRRSLTTNASYSAPIWEMPSLFQPLQSPAEQDRMDRHRVARRFSLAPSMSSSSMHYYDNSDSNGAPVFGSNSSSVNSFQRYPFDNDNQGAQRRHSVAGSSGAYLRSNIHGSSFNNLASSLESLHLDEDDDFEANDMDKLGNSWSEYYDQEEFQSGPGYDSAIGGQGRRRVSSTGTSDLGKGLTLGQLPHHGSLYVVEFKAGRNDLFYMTGGVGDASNPPLKRGDLVIVEADRGKDLGKIANDSITPQQIQALQAQQAEMAAIATQQDLSGMGSGTTGSAARTPKEIHPKRIFRLAQPSEVALLVSKNQDEMKAMVVCQSKVRQKKLPMEVVDAEYQWDRRKLTFYFIAERRIDFRELVRDLFKIYKTRIWMYAVNPLMSSGTSTSGPSASNSSLTSHNTSGIAGSDSASPLGLSHGCGPLSPSPPPLNMPSGLRSPSSPRTGLSLSILPPHHQQYQYSPSSAGLTSPRLQQHSGTNPYQQHFQQMQSPQQQKQPYGTQHSSFSQPHQQQQHSHSYPQQQQQQQQQHSYPSYANAQSP